MTNKYFKDNYSSANRNRNTNTITSEDINHDRQLIEDSFNSGIASKSDIESLFKKYVNKY